MFGGMQRHRGALWFPLCLFAQYLQVAMSSVLREIVLKQATD